MQTHTIVVAVRLGSVTCRAPFFSFFSATLRGPVRYRIQPRRACYQTGILGPELLAQVPIAAPPPLPTVRSHLEHADCSRTLAAAETTDRHMARACY